jgi:hypothetical protein
LRWGAGFDAGGFSGNVSGSGVKLTIRTDMFFDRAAIKNALSMMEYRALMRGSARIKDYARRSIKRVGRARPPLKVMRMNTGMTLGQFGGVFVLNRRNRDAIVQTIQEIQRPQGSPAGTPPFTHVPISMMLGFRRNLYNAYDISTHSAVVGPSKKGKNWTLPHLHEFGGGGGVQQRGWAFNGVGLRSKSKGPIIKWLPEGTQPRDPSKWLPTKLRRSTGGYPARPYMLPAMKKARRFLVREFRGRFVAGRHGGP